MKGTERHHLKEDEMVTGFNRFILFYEDWKREIMIFAGVVVFAAALIGILLVVRSHNQSVQSRAIGEVLSLSGDLDQKPENLAKLEQRARSGSQVRLANLELAGYWTGKDDLGKAESYLDRIPASPKDLLHYQAEDLKAQVAIRKKDYDKAIAVYKKVLDENPKVYPLDAVLFHLAEAYDLKGAKKDAADLYQRLQAEYTQSYYAYEASLKAGRTGVQK